MNRLLITLFTFLVLGFDTGCAAEKQDPVNENEAVTGYFSGEKVLIAYFSWGGTTQRMAQQIQAITGGDLFRIESVNPYPTEYTPYIVKRGNTTTKILK